MQRIPKLFLLVLLALVINMPGTDQAFASSGIWTTKASMPTPRSSLAVGEVNGILYAVGGWNGRTQVGTVEAYDPSTGSWTIKASMPTPRSHLAVVAVHGILYAVGGLRDGIGAIGTVEAYDPSTNSWTTKASLPTPRGDLAVGVVNGIIYAVGGGSVNAGTLGTVEAYDPSTNRWTTKASMPTPRDGHAVAVVNGILYAIGGEGRPGACGSGNVFTDICSTVEAYNPSTNTWTTKTSMRTRRYEFGVGVVDGILYAVAGVTTTGDRSWVLGTVEAYNPRTNVWTTKTPSGTTLASLTTPRVRLAVGTVGGVLYAVGGEGDHGPVATVEALL